MGLSCIPKSDFEDCDPSARSQVKKGARSKNRTRGHQNEEKDEVLLFDITGIGNTVRYKYIVY